MSKEARYQGSKCPGCHNVFAFFDYHIQHCPMFHLLPEHIQAKFRK